MLFALAACGQSKPAAEGALKEGLENAAKDAQSAAPAAPASEPAPEPTLVGVWYCEKDLRELMAAELGANDPQSEKFVNEYLKSFLIALTLELREDGSFTLTPDMSQAGEQMVDALRSFLVDSLKEEGISMSDDQLEAYVQVIADQMSLDIEPVEGSYNAEDGMLSVGDSDPVPYTLTANTLEFNVEGFGDLIFERIG